MQNLVVKFLKFNFENVKINFELMSWNKDFWYITANQIGDVKRNIE